MNRATLSARIAALFFISLICARCGAVGSSANPDGPGTVDFSGGVTIPSADFSGGVGIPSADAIRRDLAGPSVSALTTEITAASGARVELLDADGDTIAATTAGADGSFSFENINESRISDGYTGDNYAVYLRATATGTDGSDIVQTLAVTAPFSSLEDDSDGTPLTGLTVDYASTATALLMFQDTGTNPLTAADFPARILDAGLLEGWYGEIVAEGLDALANASDAAGLSAQTMDGASATLVLSTFVLLGDTPASMLDDIFEISSDSSEADALLAAIQAEEGFSDLGTSSFEGGLAAFQDLEDVVTNVWLLSPDLVALSRDDPEAAGFLIGANIQDKTPTEFETANADTDFVGFQIELLDSLDLASFTAAGLDLDDFKGSFGRFLAPEIVLSLDDNDVKAGVKAVVADVFDASRGNGIDDLAGVLADALNDIASDSAWWDGLLDSEGAVNEESLDNLLAFFDRGVEEGSFDGVISDTETNDWGIVMESVDLATDYAAMDSATYQATFSGVFETARTTLDPDSCANRCGSTAPSGCACDDRCVVRGDCCADKTAICGENYQGTIIYENGYNTGSIGVTVTTTTSASDTDGDGLYDEADNCPFHPNADQHDLDADGLGSACDDNNDGDGVMDSADNCPGLSSLDYNPRQYDADADGAGDPCDNDDDGDGIGDAADNCPINANALQEDFNADGVGDVCESLYDADADDDGIGNYADNCPLRPNSDQADTDHDGAGDECDTDDDNDGTTDFLDPCPYDPANTCVDTDGDGIVDGIDNCPIVSNADQMNTWGGDTVGDVCDDSDADGTKDNLDSCPMNPFKYCRTSYSGAELSTCETKINNTLTATSPSSNCNFLSLNHDTDSGATQRNGCDNDYYYTANQAAFNSCITALGASAGTYFNLP